MNCFKLIIDMFLLYRVENVHKAREEGFVATDSAELMKVTDLHQ